MTSLNEDQRVFIEHHGITEAKIYDALGSPPSVYGRMMKVTGCVVAIGVTECRKAQHTMRNASGICVQCNPATLDFRRRYRKPGWVYVAHSKLVGIIKVGFASDVDIRNDQLNKESYGSATDWAMYGAVKADEAGVIEDQTHSRLQDWKATCTYIHSGYETRCSELFNCEPDYAFSVLLGISDQTQALEAKQRLPALKSSSAVMAKKADTRIASTKGALRTQRS